MTAERDRGDGEPLSLSDSQRAASELKPLLCVACCSLWAAGGSNDHTLAWKRARFQSRLSEGRGLKLQQDSFPVTQDREVSDLSPEEQAW